MENSVSKLRKWSETTPQDRHTKGIKYATPTLSEVTNGWP